ncbi:SRPBCC family protein [bacterium SCSIO 12643]|nr:SRPBCC family protein [bacterium SCSIO 12643]
MKTFKYIGTSLLILVLIFVAFGFFQSKEVSVSRSIVIAAPMDIVFDQFNDLEKRIKWSPWEAQDSTMVTQLGDITKGVGASYSWTSENSGKGTIRYSEVVPHQLIQSDLLFGEPGDEPAQGLMIFAEAEDGVKVTWEVHMDMGNNPFMRIMGRYMDDIVGSTFEMGLESVKQICEAEKASLPDYGDVKIEETTVESISCISLNDSCSLAELEGKIAENFQKLDAYIHLYNLTPSGYSRIIFHKFDPPSSVVFQPLFVTTKPAEISENGITPGNTYAGKVITATHIGPYNKSAHVWEALDAYLAKNNLEMNGSPWEQYENTPRDEPDEDKLITHIFIPVK